MKRVKQQKKGISLIVLVITIIVMIILATAIILSLDGSDIIERAKEAQSASDIATAREIVALAKSEWAFEKVDGYDSAIEYAEAKLEEAGYKVGGNGGIVLSNTGAINILYVDSDNNQAIIPEGFVASSAAGEEKIDTGLVIYEGYEAVTDANVKTAQETRNQFVWVPVDDFNDFEVTEEYRWGYEQEPAEEVYENEDVITLSLSNDLTGEWKEWTDMRNSVKENGGFYIGRYETGTSVERAENSPVTDVLIQKNKHVYDYVTWGESMTKIGKEGAVYLSRQLYNTKSVESTLCYGVQWDAALNFISTRGVKDTVYPTDSTGKGHFCMNEQGEEILELKSILTGSVEEYGLNNIYDMAGNVWEWTMEAESNSRLTRGGCFDYEPGSAGPASWINIDLPDNTWNGVGFRITLYIK